MCALKSTLRYSRRTTRVARLLTLSELARHSHEKSLTLKLWLSVFLYAVLTGLAIQLFLLPYVFPQLHAGNGLLAGRDWVGFHEQALAQAQKISQLGWGAFLLRPDGDNAIAGVTSFFYVIFGPHPWALLPLSAAVFATGGVALFSMLKRLELDDSEAIIATMPYVFFPSALLQYGQIHKDVFCTAGVLVILWSWVSLLRIERKVREILPLIAASTLALIVISVFRPYFMFPFLGLVAVLLLWHLARVAWQAFRLRMAPDKRAGRSGLIFNAQSTLILLVLGVIVYVFSLSYFDLQLQPVGPGGAMARAARPIFIWQSNKDVRSADAARILNNVDEAALIKSIEECRPVVVLRDGAFFENMTNRVFLKTAVARAGFTSSGGTTAASNIDKGIDFCKNEDLIRYVPRALQIALFAPFPSKWLSIEKRNSSPIEIYISAVEMFYCYIAYFGLLYWLFSYKRWTVALLIPVTFALGLTLLLGLTVANVGTLYRMRFPFAMIFVSMGMAGLMQLTKIRPRWLDRLDSTAN